jgi:hypothetical protein
VVPQTTAEGTRSFITFAAKVHVGFRAMPTADEAEMEAVPVMVVPEDHRLDDFGDEQN